MTRTSRSPPQCSPTGSAAGDHGRARAAASCARRPSAACSSEPPACSPRAAATTRAGWRQHGDRQVRHQRGHRLRPGLRPARRRMADAYTKKTGTKVDAQRRRPQHVPGEHQHLPPGQPRTTSSPGSPGFRMDQFAEDGLITDVSDVWPIDGMGDTFKEASTAADGKQYFVPIGYYPWAVFYRKSVFEKNGYAPPDELRRVHHPDEGHAGQEHHAVRLRRQGRLAGDGHLRHPQHAHQRLRLPHEPDGRRRGVGQRGGQAGLRRPGRTCCPTTRTTRSAAPGRRPRPRMGKGECRDVPARHVRRRRDPGRPGRPRLLHLPRSSTELIGTDALDAPIDGFCLAAARQEPGRRQGDAQVARHRRGADAANKRRTRRSSRPTPTPAPTPTPRCRRSRSRSSARRPTSPSSWTATPTRTSRPR